MKASTIQRNTPINPRKVAVYNMLVAFYETTQASITDESAMPHRIKDIVSRITDLENGKHISIHYGHCYKVNERFFRYNQPLHHRKAALYKCLVRYLELSIRESELKETLQCDGPIADYIALQATNGLKATLDACAAKNGIVSQAYFAGYSDEYTDDAEETAEETEEEETETEETETAEETEEKTAEVEVEFTLKRKLTVAYTEGMTDSDIEDAALAAAEEEGVTWSDLSYKGCTIRM